MNEQSADTGAATGYNVVRFFRHWFRSIARLTAVLIGVPTLAVLVTGFLLLPIAVGAYVEHGLIYPMFMLNHPWSDAPSLPSIYGYLVPVWWAFGLTGLHSAFKTWEESDAK